MKKYVTVVKLLCLICVIPQLLYSQSADKKRSDNQIRGIHWVGGLSWEELLAKANAEQKYIFLDMFATWCVPCKKMDKEIYSSRKVGALADANFIAVKIQMDSTVNDNADVKQSFAIAKMLMKQYGISSVPTYLFFSPEGKIVHRDVGYKEEDEFVTLLKNAQNPKNQVYTILADYNPGNTDYNVVRELAITAKKLNQKDLANEMAHDYLQNYLYRLSDEDIYHSEKHLVFIGSFMQNSSERGFSLFRRQGKIIDKMVGDKGYADGVIDRIITMEDIDPKIFPEDKTKEKEPDWGTIVKSVTKKYNKKYAERTVTNAKIRWYRYKQDWNNLTKYNLLKLEKYGMDTIGMGKVFIGNMLWEVFEHCSDIKLINKAIPYMKVIVSLMNASEEMDTYANLLYKSGRVKEAIEWETKALKLADEAAIKNNTVVDKVYAETLHKMQKGIPTWEK